MRCHDTSHCQVNEGVMQYEKNSEDERQAVVEEEEVAPLKYHFSECLALGKHSCFARLKCDKH